MFRPHQLLSLRETPNLWREGHRTLFVTCKTKHKFFDQMCGSHQIPLYQLPNKLSLGSYISTTSLSTFLVYLQRPVDWWTISSKHQVVNLIRIVDRIALGPWPVKHLQRKRPAPPTTHQVCVVSQAKCQILSWSVSFIWL